MLPKYNLVLHNLFQKFEFERPLDQSKSHQVARTAQGKLFKGVASPGFNSGLWASHFQTLLH